ncbi:MAG TPA: hypothetical protein HPP83_10755, partial [Candidatus Hydrogenedentes bacterium]|nr:hypothetical protein [Candidatus Hydrogenedentota bacterium]
MKRNLFIGANRRNAAVVATICTVFLGAAVQAQEAPGGASVSAAAEEPCVAVAPSVNLARIVPGRTKRSSTWQRDGGNKDFFHIGPGETHVMLDVDGPGVITHVYMTLV